MANETNVNDNPIQEETHEYQAEVKQLLNILIHSVYSDKEVFLRELISNAVDALNKVHFETLLDQEIVDKDASLAVEIDFDTDKKMIAIEDTGIGMSKSEVIENIGTIARSGSKSFMERIQQAKDQKESIELIGQFGVGFYSVFMVASKVILDSRSYQPNEPAVRWESEGGASYSLEASSRTKRGTRIEIYLKEEDAEEFLNEQRLEGIVKTHSNYVPYPIRVKGKTANKEKALWTQPKSDLKPSDYHEFYQSLDFAATEPMAYFHFSADAPIQYHAVLYIPPKIAPEMLFTKDIGGIDIYAKKVFIEGKSDIIFPQYLRFVRGVLDSEDLPLSISREIVQKTPLIEKISRSVVSKFLSELQSIADNDPDKYKEFWKAFGIALKEGLGSDYTNREKLIQLLRFNTSVHDSADEFSSLDDIVCTMPEDQKEVYYVWGQSREIIERNPNIEYFKKNNRTVIYLSDPMDEFHIQTLGKYKEKEFVSVEKAKIEEDAKPETNLSEEETQSVLGLFKEILDDKVQDVRESKRLVDSPCSIVSSEAAFSGHQERIVQMINQEFQGTKKILEINMNNPIIQSISQQLKKDAPKDSFTDQVLVLFDGARVMAGLLDDPQDMVTRMYRIMEHK